MVVIGIPLDTTEVERKAVEDAAISAGVHTVYLVEEVVAAAIGARLPVGSLLVLWWLILAGYHRDCGRKFAWHCIIEILTDRGYGI